MASKPRQNEPIKLMWSICLYDGKEKPKKTFQCDAMIWPTPNSSAKKWCRWFLNLPTAIESSNQKVSRLTWTFLHQYTSRITGSETKLKRTHISINVHRPRTSATLSLTLMRSLHLFRCGRAGGYRTHLSLASWTFRRAWGALSTFVFVFVWRRFLSFTGLSLSCWVSWRS